MLTPFEKYSYVTSTGEEIKNLHQFRNAKTRFLKRRYSNVLTDGCSYDENPVFRVPSRAHQEFKADCDINTIMKRFESTGLLPNAIEANPAYFGDFSTPTDFMESLNTIIRAEDQFSALSAKVRAEFDNDPRKFLEFVHNPKNADKMVEMGLATRPAPTPEDPILNELKTLNKELKNTSKPSLKSKTSDSE